MRFDDEERCFLEVGNDAAAGGRRDAMVRGCDARAGTAASSESVDEEEALAVAFAVRVTLRSIS